jgi:hypothetical protein
LELEADVGKWLKLYDDIPSRSVSIILKDGSSVLLTEGAEAQRVVAPPGLQVKKLLHVAAFENFSYLSKEFVKDLSAIASDSLSMCSK